MQWYFGITGVSGPDLCIRAGHKPWHPHQPWPARFLCGDSDYFLAECRGPDEVDFGLMEIIFEAINFKGLSMKELIF